MRCWASDKQSQRIHNRRGSGGRTPRVICLMTSRRWGDIWILGGNSDVPLLAWVIGTSPNSYLTGTDGNGEVVASTVPNRPSSTGLGTTCTKFTTAVTVKINVGKKERLNLHSVTWCSCAWSKSNTVICIAPYCGEAPLLRRSDTGHV